jgi:hypothetical protein
MLAVLVGFTEHTTLCVTPFLLPTPRVGITILLYTEYRPLDVLSRGGLWCLLVSKAGYWLTNWLLIVICRLFATGSVTNLTLYSSYSLTMCDSSYSLTIFDSLLAAEIHVLKRTYADRKQDTSLYSSDTSIATSWLLRRCPTVNGIRCHGNICSACTLRSSGFIHQLLHSSVNNSSPSRCLGMDVQFISSCYIAVSICVSRACHDIFFLHHGNCDIACWNRHWINVEMKTHDYTKSQAGCYV